MGSLGDRAWVGRGFGDKGWGFGGMEFGDLGSEGMGDLEGKGELVLSVWVSG